MLQQSMSNCSSMSVHVTIIIIGCGLFDIKKVCVGMHYQLIIYNGKKMIKVKKILCTLMGDQKKQVIL